MAVGALPDPPMPDSRSSSWARGILDIMPRGLRNAATLRGLPAVSLVWIGRKAAHSSTPFSSPPHPNTPHLPSRASAREDELRTATCPIRNSQRSRPDPPCGRLQPTLPRQRRQAPSFLTQGEGQHPCCVPVGGPRGSLSATLVGWARSKCRLSTACLGSAPHPPTLLDLLPLCSRPSYPSTPRMQGWRLRAGNTGWAVISALACRARPPSAPRPPACADLRPGRPPGAMPGRLCQEAAAAKSPTSRAGCAGWPCGRRQRCVIAGLNVRAGCGLRASGCSAGGIGD